MISNNEVLNFISVKYSKLFVALNYLSDEPTYRLRDAPNPNIKHKTVTPISIIRGVVQLLVASCKNPNSIGPKAASKYPMDCAMPDSLAASSAFSVRKLKNIIDRLKVNPPPIPRIMIHKNARVEFPLSNPEIPIIMQRDPIVTKER